MSEPLSKKFDVHTFIFILILVFSVVLRLWGITWRPISNDEATHISFGIRVLIGDYVYDPEWHGPLEHYLIGALLYIFRPLIVESSFTLLILVRMLYASFSILLIVITYKFFRDYLGPIGSLVAAYLLAISPEILYYSRFAHEDIIAASLAAITFIFAYRFFKDKKTVYLYATSVSFFLLFSTKENWFVYVGIWISYLILISILEFVLRYYYKTENDVLLKSLCNAIKDYLTENSKISLVRIFHCIFSILVGLFIAFLLYSSLFTHPEKFFEAIAGPGHWILRHHQPRIFGPFYYWFDRIWLYDLYIIPGVILAIRKYKDRVSEFLFWWFIISFVGYSYLQEKLPRLMMHITLPGVFLVSKYLGDLLSTSKISKTDIKNVKRKIVSLSLIVLIFISSYQSVLLNYINYDRTEEPLIYARLPREWNNVYELIEKIEEDKGSAQIALVWLYNKGMTWPITFWLYWVENYLRERNISYAIYTSKPSADELQRYDVIISYLDYGIDNLPGYIRVGNYSVLRWILHERLTTETSLQNFTYDFKHYLSPNFYFFRKYPYDELGVIDHWCAVYVKEEYSNIVSEIFTN